MIRVLRKKVKINSTFFVPYRTFVNKKIINQSNNLFRYGTCRYVYNFLKWKSGLRIESSLVIYRKYVQTYFYWFLLCTLLRTPDTLRGLNFAGVKFRGFRGFRKNREIKSRRKICNWTIREIKSPRKNLKNKTTPRNFQFFFKQTYTVFIRYKT